MNLDFLLLDIEPFDNKIIKRGFFQIIPSTRRAIESIRSKQ